MVVRIIRVLGSSITRVIVSSDSFAFALIQYGGTIGRQVSFGFAWVHTGATRGRQAHLGSHGFTLACLGVAAFIQVSLGSLGSE